MFTINVPVSLDRDTPISGKNLELVFTALENWRVVSESGVYSQVEDADVDRTYRDHVHAGCYTLVESERGGMEKANLSYLDLKLIDDSYRGPGKPLHAAISERDKAEIERLRPNIDLNKVYKTTATGGKNPLAFFIAQRKLHSLFDAVQILNQGREKGHKELVRMDIENFQPLTGRFEHGMGFILKLHNFMCRKHPSSLDAFYHLDIDMERAKFVKQIQKNFGDRASGVRGEIYWSILSQLAGSQPGLNVEIAQQYRPRFFTEFDIRSQSQSFDRPGSKAS